MIIQLRDKTIAYATEKSIYHKKGELIKAHPSLIEHFIEKGVATLEKPEGEDESVSKKKKETKG